jgi:hypothetical protein
VQTVVSNPQYLYKQIFRDEKGNPSTEAGLCLQLQDFAAKTLASRNDLKDLISIPANTLYSYLMEAEKNMTMRKNKQGAVGDTMLWVRKRRRGRTPEEELDDLREAKMRKTEQATMAKMEKDDSSYKTNSDGE